MMRQRIASDVDEMEALHLQHGWIPGAASIRPSAEIMEKKRNYMSNMLTRYESLEDFILHRMFGLRAVAKGGWENSKLHVSEEEINAAVLKKSDRHEFRLTANQFAYQVPTGTHHYVMWFLLHGNEPHNASNQSPVSDDEINASIVDALHQHLGSATTDVSFVWYPNPKPTIPSQALFHVHVFWKV